MADLQPPEDLRTILREALEKACPSEDQCLADEAACFAAHPIHEFVSSEGRLEAVYANVDGLVDVLLSALAGRLLPPGAEVSYQWGWRRRKKDGAWTTVLEASSEAAARDAVAYPPSAWLDGSQLMKRPVRRWENGGWLPGDWEVVETAGPAEPCGDDIGVFKPRRCVLPKGHGGNWHDDGSACWEVVPDDSEKGAGDG